VRFHVELKHPELQQEEPVTTIADHRGATDAPDHEDDGLVACPECQKRVKPGGLGIHRAKAHGTPGASTKPARREAPPDPEEMEAEYLADNEAEAELVIEEAFELTILVSNDERDVLDALGFLDGHGDATGHLVHLVSTLCVEMAEESDVKLVLAARRGRFAETE